MKKLTLSLAFLFLTAATIIANSAPLNGLTTIEIAHKLPILLMPADFTLLIRPVLILLLAYWICQFRSSDVCSSKRVVWFAVACLANSVWFPLWHFGFFGSAILANLVALLSLYRLYRTYPKKKNSWSERIPISLFLSLAFTDLVIDINYLLVLNEWSRLGLSNVLWTILNLTILTAVALHFSYRYRDGVITAVFTWIFIGILVSIQLEELFVTLSGLFLIVIMIFGAWMFSPSSLIKGPEETSF